MDCCRPGPARVYTSLLAPAVISADSPRLLGFIPAAPTKAALLFDMLASCASIQGISWLEAFLHPNTPVDLVREILDRMARPFRRSPWRRLLGRARDAAADV